MATSTDPAPATVAAVAGCRDTTTRLHKIEGQVRGLQHLAAAGDIDELLTQIAAVRGALHAVGVHALADHLVCDDGQSTVVRHRLALLSR